MTHYRDCRFSGQDCEIGCECDGLQRDELGHWERVPCQSYEPRIPDTEALDQLARAEEDEELTAPFGPFEEDPMDVCGPYR